MNQAYDWHDRSLSKKEYSISRFIVLIVFWKLSTVPLCSPMFLNIIHSLSIFLNSATLRFSLRAFTHLYSQFLFKGSLAYLLWQYTSLFGVYRTACWICTGALSTGHYDSLLKCLPFSIHSFLYQTSASIFIFYWSKFPVSLELATIFRAIEGEIFILAIQLFSHETLRSNSDLLIIDLKMLRRWQFRTHANLHWTSQHLSGERYRSAILLEWPSKQVCRYFTQRILWTWMSIIPKRYNRFYCKDFNGTL